jgi:hypothetical protein
MSRPEIEAMTGFRIAMERTTTFTGTDVQKTKRAAARLVIPGSLTFSRDPG